MEKQKQDAMRKERLDREANRERREKALALKAEQAQMPLEQSDMDDRALKSR